MAKFFRFFLLGLMCLGLVACSRLPAPVHESMTAGDNNTAGSALADTLAPLMQKNPGLSGVVLLSDGRDALASRLSLIESAQSAIDIQYYIWNDDVAGLLMLDALRKAADRGVAVRLLLDDNNTKGIDALLWEVDQHENIQVRLFNPFVHRQFRLWSYLTDFERLNRRMHNKSLTVDRVASILGGRNIGDEYFGIGQETLFVDLDALVVGPVAKEVSADFDRYWSSESSYPLQQIVAKPSTGVSVAARARAARDQAIGRAYLDSFSKHPFIDHVKDGRLTFYWAPVHLVSDDPQKALGRAPPGQLVIDALPQLLGMPEQRLMVVSPYLVPTRNGVQFFTHLAEQGVEVRILTNSLAATDVAVVHSGYAKWRKALLAGGATLFEMKPAYSIGQVDRPTFSGSSASSLHAKTFAVDSSRLFVGSFNFDPRSARLNTEMGLVIESPEVVREVWDNVQAGLARSSYQVGLDKVSGNVIWRDQQNGMSVVYNSEPETSIFSRAAVWLLSKLPLDWLL